MTEMIDQAEQVKFCRKCETTKPISAFGANRRKKDGKHSQCLSCSREGSLRRRTLDPTASQKAALRYQIWYSREENAAKARTRAAENYANNKLRRVEQLWMRQYGITRDQYNSLVESQGDRCAICKTDNKGKNARGADCLHWQVDHDHVTREVRGLLCSRCNSILGYAKDNVGLLLRAIQYVEDPPARGVLSSD